MSAARGLSLAVLALVSSAAVAPAPALAGEDTDNCTGFVRNDMLIEQQGVWCLDADLSSASGSGAAVRVGVNNVTIDCNGHVLAGTAPTATTSRMGIVGAVGISNLTVRNCDIRGFLYGVATHDGSGHLVEDNRFRGNSMIAIHMVGGSGHMVRRNVIRDTGGTTIANLAGVVRAKADIVDNVIEGLVPVGANTLYGIVGLGDDAEISGNVVRGFPAGIGGNGIASSGLRVAYVGNLVSSDVPVSGNGIQVGGAGSMCLENRVVGFVNKAINCTYLLGNVTP